MALWTKALLLVVIDFIILLILSSLRLHLGWLAGFVDHPKGSVGFEPRIVSEVHRWRPSTHRPVLSYTPCPGPDNKSVPWLSQVPKITQNIRLQRNSPARNEQDPVIGCMTYTYHKNRQRIYDAVRTWMRYCDRLFVFSDESYTFEGDDPAMQFVTIEVYAPFWKIEDWTENMWGKVWEMWTWLNNTWCSMHSAREDCIHLDYIVACGDDTFVFIENLRAFLASPPVSERQAAGKALWLGEPYSPPWRPSWQYQYGAGYVINRVAFETVVRCDQAVVDYITRCEDEMIGVCLRAAGIWAQNFTALSQEKLFWPLTLDNYDSVSKKTVLLHYIYGSALHSAYKQVYGSGENGEGETRHCIPPAPLRLLADVTLSGLKALAFCLVGIIDLLICCCCWRNKPKLEKCFCLKAKTKEEGLEKVE